MNVIQLTEEYKQQYIDFVTTHPSGSFLQSWQWGEFQSTLGKEVVRYGVFNEDAHGVHSLIATVQLLTTKIPRLPGFYLYAPYGPLLLEVAESKSSLVTLLLDTIKKDFSTAWFIRLESKDDLLITGGKSSIHIQPGSTLVTDITTPEAELLAGMHHKTRYNIKIAAKHGVTVIFSTASSHSEAIALLTKTSTRQGYKSHSASYYTDMLSYFEKPDNNTDCKVHLYEAVLDESIIASAIMVDHGNTRTYLFGGSDDTHKNVMAPYAMHWRAIQDAKVLGLTVYDWWGIETATGATPGFVQFKLRWGGVKKMYAPAQDIVFNSKWYIVYSLLRKVNRFL